MPEHRVRGHYGEPTSPESVCIQAPGGGWQGAWGPAAPPRKAPTALPRGTGPATRAFFSSTPPECPFLNQMFLISQEAEQGANLSLIFEARSLIQYLFI